MTHPHPISLRQLRYFVTVAEELHFHRAAQRLNMSQPPLTQRIKEMERILGVELFQRIGNRVALTDAGRRMLNPARETLAQADGFCETAQRVARGECREIKVGLTTPALFFRSIQQAMRAFQEDYPDVSLDLTQINSGSALEALRRRKFDVCLMRPSPAPLPRDCEAITIERDRLMLALPAGYFQPPARKVPLSAVAQGKFISLACRSLRDPIMRLWEISGVKPSISQEGQNAPAIMALVAAGLGYTILPSSLQVIRFDQITWSPIDIDDSATEVSLHLVYHKDTLVEGVPAAFIDRLRRHTCETNVIRQFA